MDKNNNNNVPQGFPNEDKWYLMETGIPSNSASGANNSDVDEDNTTSNWWEKPVD